MGIYPTFPRLSRQYLKNDSSNVRYHDFASGIQIIPVFRPNFCAERRFEPVIGGRVTQQCSQESISLSISNPVIDFTNRLGRHTGSGCINRRIRLRIAANRLPGIDIPEGEQTGIAGDTGSPELDLHRTVKSDPKRLLAFFTHRVLPATN